MTHIPSREDDIATVRNVLTGYVHAPIGLEAKAIAALGRLAAAPSPDDVRNAALEDAMLIAATEEELEGKPPFEMSAESILVARAIVRATKRSIEARIRALKSQPANPEGFDASWTGHGPDPRIQPPREQPRGGERVSDEQLDWRCPECRCQSFARVQEQKEDGKFGDGPNVRCVNCKSVFCWPQPRESQRVSDAACRGFIERDSGKAAFALDILNARAEARDARQTIAKLTEECAQWKASAYAEVDGRSLESSRADAAEAVIARLPALLVEARDAVEPFRSSDPVMEQILWGGEPDNASATVTTTLGKFRLATRLHTKLTEELRDV